jgi:hypothetical protein
MATSYFPLIVDASNGTIDELPAGDDLNLALSNIANAQNITSLGNITASNFVGTGGVADFSNISNVDLGNVGNLHISGGTANYVLTTDGAGNLTWNATGSPSIISNGNSNVSIATIDGNVVTTANGNATLTITETGANITGYANISGNVIATSFFGEGGNISNITAANITGTVANANYATYSGTVTASAQSNITSVGILDGLAVLSSITGNADIYSKWQQDNQIWINSDAGNPSIEMGLSGRTTAATPFIDFHSSIGSGDYDARIIVDGGDGSIGNANLTINSAYVNITGSANITSNLSAGNASISGTVTLGSGTGGDLSGANTITANYFIGEGGNLSNITAGNITGQVANALIAGTVTASAQSNITSVGTLDSLVVSGNIQSNANVITDLIIGKSSSVTITATGTNQNINLVPTGTGKVDVGNFIIGNVAEPNAATDAATKLYVDTVAQGLHIHAPALAATTANLATITGGTITYTAGGNISQPGVGATLTVSGGVFDLIDTVNVQTVGTRILVKNETAQQNNGVYSWVDTTTLVRAAGEDTGNELNGGDFIFVQQGATYADTGWVQTTENVVIGTTSVVWVQFSGAGTYTAGTGLALNGTEFYIANTTVTAQSYGNGDYVASFTVNGQGQLTAASNVAIAANAANLTGSTLASGITTSSLTTVGTLGNLTVTGNISSGNANIAGTVTLGAGTGGSLTGANTITANYFIGEGGNLSNITGANITGTVANANYATYAGTVTTAAQGNITSVGTLTGLTVSNATGVVDFVTTANVSLGAVGNVKVTGGSSGQVIQTDGSGNLSFVSISSSSISNGNSNVNIPSANGNVNISAVGNANIVVVTGTGVNIAGTLNTGSGNINTTGNVSGAYFIGNGSQLTGITAGAVAAVANGNSNVNIPVANGNITFSSAGNANIMVLTGVGANLSGSMTIGAGTGGNISGANNISANYLTAANALTVTGNAAASNLTVGTGSGGAITGANSITANYFVGNGYYLNTVSAVSVANGNSNVNISTANGNVTVSVTGTSNVVTITNTGVNVTGTLSTGTANITANYYIGNGALLTGIAATTSIANGNSNVNIPVANGNVNISAVGNANILIVTGTGANISGTANVAGNLAVTGNFTLGSGAGGNISNVNVLTANTFAQGNSNVTIVSNANVNFSVTGTANVASITAAGIITTAANAAITSNALTASGVATGNSNVSTITGNLGVRSLFTTYTEGNAAAAATIANAAIHAFAAPNLAAANTTVTFTNAATMYIAGGPVANTNATITNSYALMVGGNARFFGNIIGTLANGNSNVYIATANGNVTIAAVGNTTMTISGTGANITGTGNFSGNVNAANFVGVLASGNSNVNMVANANIAIAVTGANRLVITATGTNVAGTGNFTGNLSAGNIPIMPSGNSNITITSNANISMFTVGNATAQFVVATTGVNVAGYSNATNVLGNSHTAQGTVAANLNIGNAILLSTTGLVGNIGMRGIFTTYTDNTAAAASTVANAAIHGFAQPNIAATNTTVTFTNAATFLVGGAPVANTNATITNPYSIWVANGNSRFDGGLRVNSATGFGYSSTVGAATQLTNRNTGVTVSNVSGAITLVSATTTANTYNLFTVTNTTVAATDVIILNQRSGSANSYILSVANVAAGAFNIQIFNTTAVAVAESPIINFVVFKTA